MSSDSRGSTVLTSSHSLSRSHRHVTPVAHTWMSRRVAYTIGGLHLDAPTRGVYHRWLTPACTVAQRVPPVAHTCMYLWAV
ncbi:hypothetical protein AVEN_88986-1 [Araneus ventricosus]|uniref:Uncharacterized protein n=1 Tax=Araneus ventricosus TaxID=182803 RepID=A0A4Y2DKB8_ARAVE|nr:hypothetical protein AVEN_88986-1 [Araneus ventricosus]